MPPVAFDPNRTVMGTAPSLGATQTVKPTQCTVCKTHNPAGLLYCTDCGLVFQRDLPDDAFGAPKVETPRLIGGGAEHVLRPGDNGIGREGPIVLSDPRVSRRHAKISLVGGEATIEDLGSSNGTKVAGVALAAGEKKALTGGETVSFGGYEFVFTLPGGPSAGATQTFSANKTQAMGTAPRADGAVARLVGSDGTSHALKPGGNVFGRRDGHDVVIPDGYVSGKHGLVEIDGDEAFVTDLGSTNGTVVAGVKIAPNVRTKLRDGDEIRLGSLTFTVVRG